MGVDNNILCDREKKSNNCLFCYNCENLIDSSFCRGLKLTERNDDMIYIFNQPIPRSFADENGYVIHRFKDNGNHRYTYDKLRE